MKAMIHHLNPNIDPGATASFATPKIPANGSVSFTIGVLYDPTGNWTISQTALVARTQLYH